MNRFKSIITLTWSLKNFLGFVLFVDFQNIRYSLLTTLTPYDFGTFEQILTFLTKMAEKSGKIQVFLLGLIHRLGLIAFRTLEEI